MSFQIGERVGDYEVIDILGAGGMGKVYKVRNVFSERVEAMKVLLPNLSSDPELADRFMREIKVQASLEHPNIAALRTAQQVNNQLLMIVEFVDGVSLEQMMRQGPVPLTTAVECISQVLAALGYAHKHGIIHRDIKPGNIMVTHAGVVKLMDFGIAKAVDDRRLTQTGRTVGSLYYMSPEQIQGSPNLDGRADVYSVGITLYELVTGRRPFQGDSDYSIMAAHLSQTPVPPVQLDPRVPEALNEVILQSIAKDPAQRFQSGEAFKNALDSVARSLAVPPSATAPLPKAAAAVAAPVPEAQVKPGSSKRALYMVAGSLVTVIVLAVAALQLPQYFQTKAIETNPIPQAEPSADPGPPVQAAPAPEPQVQLQEPVGRSAVPSANPPPKVAAPAPDRRVTRNEPGVAMDPAASQAPAASPVQTAVPAADQSSAPQAALPQAAPPPAAAALLQAAADRFNLLATRVNTARASLTRLEQSQARMGLGLRGDVATAANRLVLFMDQAEAALKAGDPAGSKKALDSAERELERIEKVLEGR